MLAPPRDVPLAEVFATASPLEPGPSSVSDLIAAVLANRPSWMRDAACAEHPEVSFFPERGDDVRPAKRVCAGCLVKAECRTWAIAQGPELAGVWAGTTTLQRRQMRAAVPVDQRPPARRKDRLPTQTSIDRRIRPVRVMERISAFLGASPGWHDVDAICGAVTGGSHAIDAALRALAGEGYIDEKVGGIDRRGRRSPRKRFYGHAAAFIDAGSVTVVADDSGGLAAETTDPPKRGATAA